MCSLYNASPQQGSSEAGWSTGTTVSENLIISAGYIQNTIMTMMTYLKLGDHVEIVLFLQSSPNVWKLTP